MKLARYREIREIGSDLNQKISEFLIEKDKDCFTRSARSLGMLEGNSIILESEESIGFIADFMLFEGKIGNENCFDYYYENAPDLNDTEEIILEGMANQVSSLYEIQKVDAINKIIFVKDLLNSGLEYQIMDVNMSNTLEKAFLIFTRLMPIEGVWITTGVAFNFDLEEKERILTRLSLEQFKRNRKELKPAEKFLFFYKLNLSIGIPTRFE